MPNVNQVQVAGHLGRDAKVGEQQNGKKYAFFSIAITEKFGEKETTTWVNCKWFNAFANVDEWLTKGRGVTIFGKLAIDKPREEGQRGGEMYVRVDQCGPTDSSFSKRRSSADDTPPPARSQPQHDFAGVTDDDVPF